MQLNVVIADDEYFIRKRLIKLIPWEELNLSLAGEAEDGLQVLELIENNRIDIILLDIEMPQMTGLDAARRLSTLSPHTKIIILSGFNEFTYAQDAIKCGVTDYLLKPVEAVTLIDTLSRCIASVNTQLIESEKLSLYEQYKRSSLLNKILFKNEGLDELLCEFPYFCDIKYTFFISFYISKENDPALQLIQKELDSRNIRSEVYYDNGSCYVLQIFLCEKTNAAMILDRLQKFVCGRSGYIFIASPQKYTEFTGEWLSSYKEALKLLSYRYFYNSAYFNESMAIEAKIHSSLNLSEIRDILTLNLNARNLEQLSLYIEDLFMLIRDSRDINVLNLIITEILVTLNLKSRGISGTRETLTEYIQTILNENYELDTLKDIIRYHVEEILTTSTSSPSDVLICKKTMQYIDENYNNQDLSVNQIAEYLGLNPSYLGVVFKKINYYPVSQHITKVRMKEAVRLLEKGCHRITDIAEMAGYSDVFYFSKKFKKIYGCSPSEYHSNSSASRGPE